MKSYCFRIPASFSLWLKADNEEQARILAKEWQAHAMKWDQLTTETDPGEHLDIPVEAGTADFYGDSYAYIEDGEIELACPPEEITEQEQEECDDE